MIEMRFYSVGRAVVWSWKALSDSRHLSFFFFFYPGPSIGFKLVTGWGLRLEQRMWQTLTVFKSPPRQLRSKRKKRKKEKKKSFPYSTISYHVCLQRSNFGADAPLTFETNKTRDGTATRARMKYCKLVWYYYREVYNSTSTYVVGDSSITGRVSTTLNLTTIPLILFLMVTF